MKKIFYRPFLITTDYAVDFDFFTPYIKDEWIDANILYGEYLEEVTGGEPMKKFYVQEIHEFDRPLLKIVSSIFRAFQIKPKEFRCDFFKVLPGGELPIHSDNKAELAFCLPICKNTGYTYFKQEDVELKVKYQSLVALNTNIMHGVTSPDEERLLFRIAVHDIPFEELR